MPIRTITVEAVTASPDTSIRDLVHTMRDEGIGDVVITDGNEPVGIVTDRDVALALTEHDDLESLRAEDLMSTNLVTVDADAEAVELPKRMAEGKVRRMIVVDGDGSLVGIATLDDVVATVGRELEDIATVIEAQSPGYSPS